jgi:aspartate/methionine/tyrosine aminotransferase
MKRHIDKHDLDSILDQMGISDISCATIRQAGEIARTLERNLGVEFLHLEMGIPGLPPEQVGIDAECSALKAGVASIYPNMMGIPQLKQEASRFLKAFLDIDVASRGCIPTVGSMQGSFSSFILCSHLDQTKDTVLFIDPGFPVQRTQTKILGIRSESFDIYDCRGAKLAAKLEEYFSTGRISAIIYSSPNNPAWFNLTEEELRIIGEMATRHDVVVLEDLAYMCMDFRKPLGKPFEPPFQPTVAKYTDNYIIMMSASKMFSYAGQRIAVLAVSDKLYEREYPALRDRYGIARAGDALVLGILYALSSGTSHSAQYALAAMFKAASDGDIDFVETTSEYARRASLTKKMFLDNGFHIVYSKDGDVDVSDGFFYTIGYGDMSGEELMRELMLSGICSISLSLTGSSQPGVRICVSQLNRPEQFVMLEERLKSFASDHI